MSANKLIFKKSEAVRDAISNSQKKEIASYYKKWADELEKKYIAQSYKNTPSSALYQQQIRNLQSELKATSNKVMDEVYLDIKQNIQTVAGAVVKDAVNFAVSLGFDKEGVKAAYTSVPDYAIRSLLTGNVYESGWSLSQRIWSANEQIQQKAYEIVAQGVATNTPIYEISKSLAGYVRPEAAKMWNPKLLYAKKDSNGKPLKDKNGKIIYERGDRIYPRQVDYNAQRLARTLTQHTYQQTFQATTKDNPFITKYQWLANGSRVCEICADRDGQYFEKDDLPLDHPNGMCTMVPVVDDNMVDTLADWYASEDGEYPDIDKFAKSFGYTANKNITQTAIDNRMAKLIKKYGYSSAKTHTAWLNKLNNSEKYAVKQFKNKMGLKWPEFYNKYAYKEKIGKAEKVIQKVQSAVITATEKAGTIAKDLKQFADDMLYKVQNNTADFMRSLDKTEMLTSKEVGAIKSYSGSSYGTYNEYLRARETGNIAKAEKLFDKMSDYHKENTRILENLFLKNEQRLESDIVIRRGSSIGDFTGLFTDMEYKAGKEKFLSEYWKAAEDGKEKAFLEQINETMKGKIGTYASPTSTSSMYERGFSGELEIVMNVKAGTRGMGITNISKYGESEGEFLLAPGCKTRFIRLEKSDGHRGSKWRLFVEVFS